jgi:hypothetical protein
MTGGLQLPLLPTLGPRLFRASLLASDTSVEAALEPVKLFECIGKGGGDVGSRFAVQPVHLKPGTGGRIPEGASQFSSGDNYES